MTSDAKFKIELDSDATGAIVCWHLVGAMGEPNRIYTCKHIALESLEQTYAKQVEEQKFHVRWTEGSWALITIDGVGLFTLSKRYIFAAVASLK